MNVQTAASTSGRECITVSYNSSKLATLLLLYVQAGRAVHSRRAEAARCHHEALMNRKHKVAVVHDVHAEKTSRDIERLMQC